MPHSAPQKRADKNVGHQVDRVKQRDLMHIVAEFLDHHETREDHKNLSPRAGHELESIIKPVASAQHHLFDLRGGRFELRIGKHRKQGDHHRDATPGHVDGVVR